MARTPLPITDQPIRFALVGCGRISENHFAALDKHAERARLVAVCDTDPSALAKECKRSVQAALAAESIPPAVHCPKPLHHQPAYAGLADARIARTASTPTGRRSACR